MYCFYRYESVAVFNIINVDAKKAAVLSVQGSAFSKFLYRLNSVPKLFSNCFFRCHLHSEPHMILNNQPADGIFLLERFAKY
jgi:hypothetical protein